MVERAYDLDPFSPTQTLIPQILCPDPAQGTQSLRVSLYEELKRLIDLVGASTLLVLSLPLMAVIAVLIKISSRGPVLYVQRRLTRNGQIFSMLKFRTMTVDAERERGAVLAARDDARVTAIGAILRRHRLDELPQLFNVLSGEMSLIGPRPERPEIANEIAKDIPWFSHRLRVRAGITGLAQVSSGYAASSDEHLEKLAFDLSYIERRSLLLDLSIAARTVRVVMTGYGSR